MPEGHASVAPAWAAGLIGWCLVAGIAEARSLRQEARLSARGETACPPLTPRGLRAIDGVGPALAVDLARFLWGAGGAAGGGLARLEEVSGVGSILAERVRAHVATGGPALDSTLRQAWHK